MTTYQVFAVPGGIDDTLHVQRYDPEDAELVHRANTGQMRINGQWQKCEAIGFVEAENADSALDMAYAQFVR